MSSAAHTVEYRAAFKKAKILVSNLTPRGKEQLESEQLYGTSSQSAGTLMSLLRDAGTNSIFRAFKRNQKAPWA